MKRAARPPRRVLSLDCRDGVHLACLGVCDCRCHRLTSDPLARAMRAPGRVVDPPAGDARA